VDPTSPFTGGALLGDRIRMSGHSGDAGVFIRSMASREALGGVSPSVHEAADLLDAAGYDPVVVETVGVGQDEVEVARVADTTVVVLAPGGGDEVQAMKAGLIEVADLLVVNQSDRDGAEDLAGSLESALSLRSGEPPPVLRTVATTGDGIEGLRERIDARGASAARGALDPRRLERARTRIRSLADRARAAAFWASREADLERLAREVAAGRSTAGAAAARLVERSA
jgi:LAO/AO transport system kinase